MPQRPIFSLVGNAYLIDIGARYQQIKILARNLFGGRTWVLIDNRARYQPLTRKEQVTSQKKHIPSLLPRHMLQPGEPRRFSGSSALRLVTSALLY
ncbi:MAG: hypothetical protein ACHBN1_14360 [Heteroscytonema crispum UTEX LB 1556]